MGWEEHFVFKTPRSPRHFQSAGDFYFSGCLATIEKRAALGQVERRGNVIKRVIDGRLGELATLQIAQQRVPIRQMDQRCIPPLLFDLLEKSGDQRSAIFGVKGLRLDGGSTPANSGSLKRLGALATNRPPNLSAFIRAHPRLKSFVAPVIGL